ncbi:hypothetical protein GN244_ATG08461 [Phytophthora infestans]|uniref:Secreted RxLR effector peptide protein n=1 Tax=Phytophthora infestans TaxID=4787 RepID=A0A833WV60_PHYIN|nr:hypothetical protein GN244_ATG09251 [Phytophthora infestans]KAF4039328.1 hypothetical protein GN244_ATG08461 [Phytophthora infestans]
MQMVLLIAFIAFVSSCAATSKNLNFDRIGVAKTNPDADRVLAAEQKILHRSLRWHEPGKVAGFKDEERGAIDKVEDVASKVSGIVVKAAKTPSKLSALIVKNI